MSHWFTDIPIHGFIGWLILWFVDSLVHWWTGSLLIAWLSGRSTDSFTHWSFRIIHPTDSLIDWLVDWLGQWFSKWFVHWFNDSLIHWFTDWLVCRFVDSLFHWVFVSLIHCDCTVASLILWFVDSLVHWFIDSLLSLLYSLIDSVVIASVASLICSLLDSLVGSFIAWFVDALLRSFIGTLIPWRINSLIRSVSSAWFFHGLSGASQQPFAHSLVHLTTSTPRCLYISQTLSYRPSSFYDSFSFERLPPRHMLALFVRQGYAY